MGLKNSTIEAGEACKKDLITKMEEVRFVSRCF